MKGTEFRRLQIIGHNLYDRHSEKCKATGTKRNHECLPEARERTNHIGAWENLKNIGTALCLC